MQAGVVVGREHLEDWLSIQLHSEISTGCSLPVTAVAAGERHRLSPTCPGLKAAELTQAATAPVFTCNLLTTIFGRSAVLIARHHSSSV